jgi:glycosyltransferase involved in cell wall biosynthesis
MRVGFITYGMDRPLTGIGRYTLEMARAFEQSGGDAEIVLLTAGGLGALADTPLERVPLPGCRLLPGLLTLGHGLLPYLAQKHRLDIIHDPVAMTPMLFGAARARIISTVHDIIPISYPGSSSRLDEWVYRYWLPFKLPQVDAVITVSEYSRGDIAKHLRVKPERVRVIYYGVREHFRPIPADEADAYLLKRYQIDYPYVLYVGNLTKRKNIELALRGFAGVAQRYPDLRFVLAGPSVFKQTPVGAIAASLGIADRVVVTGAAGDADLPPLYSRARTFLFPSLYEGFGLPVIEAMACGAPVIASTAASLPEVAADAGILVDPHSDAEMTAALERVLSDESLRADLREKGFRRAAMFTWTQTARQTIDLYRDVLSR